MKQPRIVQVLHKCDRDALDRLQKQKHVTNSDALAALAVGKTFRFKSGDAYSVQASGAVINANPKPWRTKAERKRHLKERRAARKASQL